MCKGLDTEESLGAIPTLHAESCESIELANQRVEFPSRPIIWHPIGEMVLYLRSAGGFGLVGRLGRPVRALCPALRVGT